MQSHIAQQLIDLNRDFYNQFARDFDESRATPQPGFHRLLEWLPSSRFSILDVGCGNGRFAQFLREAGRIVQYTGVDFSESLLRHARTNPEDHFLVRDISKPDSLDDLPQYDIVVCLSTLQHIPGKSQRLALMKRLLARLSRGGRLILGNWQFASSDRQRRKIRPWSEIGLAESDVEEGDYLLTWQRGGYGLRYVALIDAGATSRLAAASGLTIVDQFLSDGQEGNLNLYTLLEASDN